MDRGSLLSETEHMVLRFKIGRKSDSAQMAQTSLRRPGPRMSCRGFAHTLGHFVPFAFFAPHTDEHMHHHHCCLEMSRPPLIYFSRQSPPSSRVHLFTSPFPCSFPIRQETSHRLVLLNPCPTLCLRDRANTGSLSPRRERHTTLPPSLLGFGFGCAQSLCIGCVTEHHIISSSALAFFDFMHRLVLISAHT